MRLKSLLRALGVAPVLCASLACGHSTKVVNIQFPTLVVKDQSELKQDGLIVSISPVTSDKLANFPQVYKTYRFGDADSSRTLHWQLTPVPGTFQVKVINNTGHVVKLTEAIFRLEDDQKNTYPLIEKKDELVALNESNSQSTYAQLDPAGMGMWALQVAPQIRSNAATVPLLNREVELLNGDEFSGFLVFNTNVHSKSDYEEFMNRLNRFKLRMAELPIALDAAGKVSKTTEFDFYIERSLVPMAAICPKRLEPSLANCTLKANSEVAKHRIGDDSL